MKRYSLPDLSKLPHYEPGDQQMDRNDRHGEYVAAEDLEGLDLEPDDAGDWVAYEDAQERALELRDTADVMWKILAAIGASTAHDVMLAAGCNYTDAMKFLANLQEASK